MQRRLSTQIAHPRLGTFVGTPSYSSPEQISGHLLDVDTRADVYSLGVVLYELLVGATPYGPDELAGKSPLELHEMLSDSEPPTPQARFAALPPDAGQEIARNRSLSVERLSRGLGTDLSWIMLKCLERDPEDRYPSVLELENDLKRWLQCQNPGLEHEDTLFTIDRLAEALRAQGRLEQASQLGEQATRIGAVLYHRHDHRLARLKRCYGQTLAELGLSADSEDLPGEAREALRAASGHSVEPPGGPQRFRTASAPAALN